MTDASKNPRRVRSQPGTAPGTLVIDPDAHAPEIEVMAYGPDDWTEAKIADPGELTPYAGRWPVVWVNVVGLGSAEVLTAIGEMFGLHRLALEDVVNVGQRPKVEPYDDHVFVVVRLPEPQPPLHGEQVALFLGRNYVLTFQERPGDVFDAVRRRIREGRGRMVRRSGPDYLAYALIDATIDSYFPLLESLGMQLESLEDEILESAPAKNTVSRIQVLRGEVRKLLRMVRPLRDVANALRREDVPFVTENTQLYLRDCEDHAIQLIELAENYREMCAELMNAYHSSVSNGMNEIMKVLTIIATIFIPLGFVAGVYGMNFDPGASPWNMPELGWYWGYPAALTAMVLIAGGLLLFFRRRGWLG